MEDEPEPDATMAAQIILLGVLTLVNAFFASAEMALVSLNKTRMNILANEGNKKAEILCGLIDEPNKFLSTIQVGITLAGFFASASAATGISDELGSLLTSFSIPYGSQIAFVGVTIILSYFTLVFGELFPKRIALRNAEKVAMFSVKPILLISKITAPFVKILSASTGLLVKITGLNKGEVQDVITKEEIKSLIKAGHASGVLDEKESDMIECIFEFNDKKAERVMTPRTEVYLIDASKPLNSYLDELLEMRYARIPVYENDIDNVIGILYMKDFVIEARKKGFENVVLKDILQEPYFVPECKYVRELFRELQATKVHMAVIIDEYGGFSGIVTMEDLLEEIVGEIDDEYHTENSNIKRVEENIFIIDGLASLEDISDRLNIDIKSNDIETLSGFLISLLGKIPTSEEEKIVKYNNVIFKIDKVSDKKIERVIVNL